MTGSKRLLALLAVLALTPTAAVPQSQNDALRQSGAQTFQFQLGNGMQVLVIPDHRAPVATQMLWFKVGGVDDPAGISGMAHFFEHMMFRGTRKVPGEGFTQAIARNGGESNAFTAHDYTAYYEQIAKDRLNLAMQLEADRLANLDLSDANVATEREIVMEERRMRTDNDPQALATEQMSAALHLSHPYGRPVVGWMEELRHIDRASASDFYRRHYAPNNAILVVAGDVTPEDVRVMAQREYGGLALRQLTPRAENAHPPRLAESRIRITRSDAKVPSFSRFYRVPSYATAGPGRAEALETLAQTLGGGQTSLLYRVLVEEKKLATNAGAYYDGYRRDMGEFGVYATPRPGVSLENLERELDRVLARAASAAPAGGDLDRAKTQLVADVIFRRDSQFQMAYAYGQALVIGLTVQDVNAWPGRIRAVSGNAVRSAAASLNRRESVTGYLLPGGGK
ncbi:MAG TPA: pitrilysin family protein [Rhizomicrobium sp.]|nr:pitrilysin family protein [Rhizomicrobium sp.]